VSAVAPAYEAEALLGAGGIGRVYRARHLPSGQKVALKTLHAGSSRAETYGLLVREAAAAAQLRHPNVVELLDFVVEDGRPYLVLELVEGGDIESWVDVWPGWPTVATAMEQTLDGLSVAHAAGILHRDLKPANLLWSESSGVKIADFGMAEVVDPLAVDAEHLFGGTPLYMAPEQLDPFGHQGPWTDLYAFGAVLYVLLAGREPVAPERDWKAAKRRPPLPFSARAGLVVPDDLGRLVESLLAPEPRARPRFASEVRGLLAELGRGVFERGAVLAAGVPSSRRGSSTLASAPTAVAIHQTSDLASAPTAASAPSTPSASDVRWTVPAPPPSDLPFRISAPAEVDAATSLLQVRATPLVGRERERALLTELVSDVVNTRSARALVLVGEAGVGKSRLARWALGEVERTGRMEGAAAGYDVSGTTDGLRRALRALLGSASEANRQDPRPVAWRRFDIEHSRVDREKLFSWLEAPAGATAISESERVELSFEVFRWVALQRPVYLWLDDVAWSHDGALELAKRVLRTEQLPLALVMTVRAGAAEHPSVRKRLEVLAQEPRASQHEVARLDLAERQALLEAAAPVSPETAASIAEQVDETPLVLVQLAHELIGSGGLVLGTAGYGPPDGQTLSAVLARQPLAHLLAERVGKLLASFRNSAAEAEGVLLRIALLGPRIEERALHASLGAEQRLATVVLGRALLHGILRLESGGAYRFEHNLIRDAVLERLEVRRDANEIATSVARALLATYGDERWGVRVRAALLLEQGEAIDEALRLLLGTALDLALMNALEHANELIGMAREWVARHPNDERRARLLFAESQHAYYGSEFDRAFENATAARELATRAGSKELAIGCLTGQASILFYMRRLTEAERAAREALAGCRLGDLEYAEAGVNAGHRLAEIALLRGNFREAAESYDLALKFAESERYFRRGNYILLDRIELDLFLGEVESAEARLAPLVELAKEPTAGDWREFAEDVALRLAVRRGGGPRVLDQIRARAQQYQQRGDKWRLTAFRLLVAVAAAQSGDAGVAHSETDTFVQAFAEYPHEKPFTLWALGELPRLLATLGLEDDAARVHACRERLEREVAAGFANS